MNVLRVNRRSFIQKTGKVSFLIIAAFIITLTLCALVGKIRVMLILQSIEPYSDSYISKLLHGFELKIKSIYTFY